MKHVRRWSRAGSTLVLTAMLVISGPLSAQVTETFAYDELGRLIQIGHGDGSTVDQVFDAAGNRLTVVGTKTPPVDPDPPTPVTFERTLALSPSSGQTVDLRAIANAAGYNGQQPAKIIFDVPAGVAIIAAPGGVALVSGEWPTGAYTIDIALKVSGQIYGGGGTGGTGAGGQGPAAGAGTTGGDAVVAQAPLNIEVLPGGAIAGGGGGGGGAESPRLSPIIGPRPGGGGGGGFPNGAGGASSAPTANSGLPGTAAGGGAGGVSIPAGPSGKGGNGGAAGSPGEAGQATPSTESSAGAGGAPGFAIRKNGHAVTVTNSGGAITGAQE